MVCSIAVSRPREIAWRTDPVIGVPGENEVGVVSALREARAMGAGNLPYPLDNYFAGLRLNSGIVSGRSPQPISFRLSDLISPSDTFSSQEPAP